MQIQCIFWPVLLALSVSGIADCEKITLSNFKWAGELQLNFKPSADLSGWAIHVNQGGQTLGVAKTNEKG